MKKILLWLNIGLIFISFGAYISPFVSAGDYWLFAVLGLFYPWLLLINVLCILLWAAFRKWYFLFSFIWLLIGWGHFTNIIGLTFPSQIIKNENIFKVMTYNCRSFSKDTNLKKKWASQEIKNFIEKHQPDVIAFQEFPMGNAAKKYTDILRTTHLQYHYQDIAGQLALFSVFPIEKKEIHYFTNQSNGYLFADIKINQQTIRFFNVHLQSNVVTQMAEKVKAEGNLQEKDTWLSIKGMIGKYKRAAAVRTEQAKIITKKVKESPHFVIICGDFNDVPQSNAYHILATAKQDAFKKAGSGLGTTYAGSIPGLRIDFILNNPKIKVLAHETIHFSYSDHYPVSTYFSLPDR